MSCLQNLLNNKKATLRPTATTITQLDGKRFVFQSSNIEEIEAKQFGFIVDTKPDNIPAKILDGLYLGSQDCCDQIILTAYNINCVLSVGIEAPTKYDNIVYKFVQCFDLPETNLIKNGDEQQPCGGILMECINFIETRKNGNLLVHCNAGVSRSATIVIGYLILVHHYSYIDAYNFVKSVRSCIRPNDGFVKQLMELEKKKNIICNK